jgi:hypothetical protein
MNAEQSVFDHRIADPAAVDGRGLVVRQFGVGSELRLVAERPTIVRLQHQRPAVFLDKVRIGCPHHLPIGCCHGLQHRLTAAGELFDREDPTMYAMLAAKILAKRTTFGFSALVL